MKVILLKDVPKVGQIHEIKEVADGFALNSLIPRGLALLATPEKLEAHKKKLAAQNHAARAEEERLGARLAELAKTGIEIVEKVDKSGHLYKKIDARALCGYLKKAHVACDERMVEKFPPLKEVGVHTVTILACGKRWAVPVQVKSA